MLKFKFPFNINVGDKFEITAGCDKEFSTCCSKFNNAINFRGEPNIPRNEKILKFIKGTYICPKYTQIKYKKLLEVG